MLHTPNYDVRGGRAYCGPTAIAAVTGEPISRIVEVIREQIGTKVNGHALPVIGVSNHVLLETMKRLGWLVVEDGEHGLLSRLRPGYRQPVTSRVYRFGDFLDQVQMRGLTGPCIVNVTRHYYAVDADEICDTRTKIPIEIHRFKNGRRRWVQRWWQFEKNGADPGADAEDQ